MDSPRPFRAIFLQSLVVSVLTFGSGAFLYWLMGVTPLSAVLFALACGIALMIASLIV